MKSSRKSLWATVRAAAVLSWGCQSPPASVPPTPRWPQSPLMPCGVCLGYTRIWVILCEGSCPVRYQNFSSIRASTPQMLVEAPRSSLKMSPDVAKCPLGGNIFPGCEPQVSTTHGLSLSGVGVCLPWQAGCEPRPPSVGNLRASHRPMTSGQVGLTFCLACGMFLEIHC